MNEIATIVDKTVPQGPVEQKRQVIRVVLRDGTVEEFQYSSNGGCVIGASDGILKIYKDTATGLKKLLIAYPLDVVRSWQLIRGDGDDVKASGQDSPKRSDSRFIMKMTSLAGEIPVGTIVAWSGKGDVPCGWIEVKL